MGANPKLKWRPDIEGLRGIAVLLVVLYHADVPFLTGGFVGVDVFFVLSGYLITTLLSIELQSTDTVSLKRFYARRIRRLLPAAALVIVSTLVASALVLSPLKQMEVARSGAGAAAYFANILFAIESADYFGGDVATNPLLHMWSLSVEEQFYLVWPVLLLLGWRLGGRRGLVAVLAIVAAWGFALSASLVSSSPEWAFYGTHSRAWQFAVGGLAGLATVRGGPFLLTAGWVGLAAVVISGAMLTGVSPFPGWAAVPVTLGAAIVLVATGTAPRSLLSVTLSSRPLRELGRLSYTWYLWHWPALVLAEIAWGPLSLATKLLVAAGTLVLSQVTYWLVENPVRQHPRLAPARASFGLMAVLLSASLGAALAARTVVINSAGGDPARFLAARNDAGQIIADGCLLSWERTVIPPCEYGSADSATTVVLFGDSHAAHLFPAVEHIAIERGWRLVVRAKSTCAPAEFTLRNRFGQPIETCSGWRADVKRELAELQPDLVLVSWMGNHPSWESAWAEALAASLIELRGVTSRLVYVRDVPTPLFDVPDCLALSRGSCDVPVGDAWHAPEGWEIVVADEAGIEYVDLTEVICPGELCRAQADGIVTFRDAHHLTASFAATLASPLGNALDSSLAARQQ